MLDSVLATPFPTGIELPDELLFQLRAFAVPGSGGVDQLRKTPSAVTQHTLCLLLRLREVHTPDKPWKNRCDLLSVQQYSVGCPTRSSRMTKLLPRRESAISRIYGEIDGCAMGNRPVGTVVTASYII